MSWTLVTSCPPIAAGPTAGAHGTAVPSSTPCGCTRRIDLSCEALDRPRLEVGREGQHHGNDKRSSREPKTEPQRTDGLAARHMAKRAAVATDTAPKSKGVSHHSRRPRQHTPGHTLHAMLDVDAGARRAGYMLKAMWAPQSHIVSKATRIKAPGVGVRNSNGM